MIASADGVSVINGCFFPSPYTTEMPAALAIIMIYQLYLHITPDLFTCKFKCDLL